MTREIKKQLLEAETEVLNSSNIELSKAKEDMLNMLEEMKVEQEKSRKIREEVDSLKQMVESYSLLLRR